MEEGLKKNTGQELDYWIDIVDKSGIEKHKAIIDFLKKEHAFSHGFANFVALKARKADAGSNDDTDLITNQYVGKESLKLIFIKLSVVIQSFGDDITITPKKDSVSMIRKRQFALVKPATKSRIDLGLKLKDIPNEGVLGDSGPFGSMCTHRIKIESLEEVDDVVIGWLRKAYEMSI